MGPLDRGQRRAQAISHGRFPWASPIRCRKGKQNTGAPNTRRANCYCGRVGVHRLDPDNRFRAFDSKTGKELWVTKLDYTATAVPMTYHG